MKNYSYSKNKHCKCGKLITNQAKQCMCCMSKNRNRFGNNNTFFGKHHTEITKEKIKNSEYHKNRTRRTKEEIAKYKRIYYKQNKIHILQCHKQWIQKERQTNIIFKMLENLRRRIHSALKHNTKSKSTLKLLGCSIKELKQHLEKQFKKGMNWKNWGTGWNGKGMKEWHIDHIRPCASFDLSKASEQSKCFNYTNLRPLWAKVNLKRLKKGQHNEEKRYKTF